MSGARLGGRVIGGPPGLGRRGREPGGPGKWAGAPHAGEGLRMLRLHMAGELKQERPHLWDTALSFGTYPKGGTGSERRIRTGRYPRYERGKTLFLHARCGAADRTRTCNLPITSGLLRQLSYTRQYGRGGGIRTPGALSRPSVFKTAALSLSATPPKRKRPAGWANLRVREAKYCSL